MAKLDKYNGSVSLMAGITQMDGDYALVEAHAVQIDEEGTRLDEELNNIKDSILTENDVKEIIAETGAGEGGTTVISIQADWDQKDATKSSYILNKPDIANMITAEVSNGVLIVKNIYK